MGSLDRYRRPLDVAPPKRHALRILAPLWLMCASMLLGATGVVVVNPKLWRDEVGRARAVLDQPHSTEAQMKSAAAVLLKNWRDDIERLRKLSEHGNETAAKHGALAIDHLRDALR